MKRGVVEVALVLSIEHKQSRDTGADESGDEMTQDKIARLSHRRLNDTEEKDGGRTEGRNDCWGVIDVAESRTR